MNVSLCLPFLHSTYAKYVESEESNTASNAPLGKPMDFSLFISSKSALFFVFQATGHILNP